MLATDQKEDEGGKLGNFGAEWEGSPLHPGLRPAWGPTEGQKVEGGGQLPVATLTLEQ